MEKAGLAEGLETKTRLATVEEKIGGEEAKTVSLDKSFKEFCSTQDQRVQREA